MEEQQKRDKLQQALDDERSSAAALAEEHDKELENAARKREAQLTGRIRRLSKAVAAAASGDLKYLAAHPEVEGCVDDDLGAMTIDLEKLFGQFNVEFERISQEAKSLSDASEVLGSLSESINSGAVSDL